MKKGEEEIRNDGTRSNGEQGVKEKEEDECEVERG